MYAASARTVPPDPARRSEINRQSPEAITLFFQLERSPLAIEDFSRPAVPPERISQPNPVGCSLPSTTTDWPESRGQARVQVPRDLLASRRRRWFVLTNIRFRWMIRRNVPD